jgi:rhamnogalacturonan acetylesterase
MTKRVSFNLSLRATLSVAVSLLMLSVASVLMAQDQAKPAPAPAVSTDPAIPARPPLPVPANPKLPSLFLVGDSTVRNGRGDGGQGQWGWGEPLFDLFDASKINVVNRAIGGHSSRSYISSKQWDETLALIKPGDIVLFQWGHNDGGPLDDPARSRGSIHGTGEESQEVDNPVLKIHETVHTYGWYLRKYVTDTQAKGAIPIICSLVPRKIWKDGKVVRNTDSYAGWAREVAEQQHVGFVDLNEIIGRRYDALGEAAVEPLFADPHTHTSRAGAELNAECVVSGLKALPHDPVAGYFSAKGQAIPASKLN